MNKDMHEQNSRKTITKADILLAAGILILAAAGFFAWKLTSRAGGYADVMIDGTSVKTLPLAEDTRYVVSQEAGTNTVVIRDGKVTIEDADCPDKICEQHAAISETGETIICLPHKLVVEIK